MLRRERLVIRLSEIERTVIEELAKVERLPMSTLARRLLLKEAEQKGLDPIQFS